MSFATPAQVKSFFRDFAISTESAVTDAKIQAWLDSEYEYIKGKIGILYSMPITTDANPLSVKILAEIEAMKVAGIVDDVLNNYSEANKKPQWEKRAMMKLKEIIPDLEDGKQPEPVFRLPDLQYIGTRTQKGTIRVSATTGAVFSKGGDNW